MTDRPIPPALARVGIESLSDNLPEGAGIDIARDFVRVFRAEIEARVLGWQRPLSARPLHSSPVHSQSAIR